MNIKTKLLCTAVLLGAGYAAGYAQQVQPASGGNASGSGGSASFTIGQIFYTTPTGASGSSDQGIQSIAVIYEVLPVNFLSFKVVKYDNNSVFITWQTATEQNNDYFVVEKSSDGRVFTELTRVAGQGTSNSTANYKAFDYQPHPGSNYYRIRQTDIDGASTYTPVSTIQFSTTGTAISIFPNPTSHLLTLQTDATGNRMYQISDLKGNMIESKRINSGSMQINISHLPAATYIFNILHENQIVESFKITKL